MEKGGRIEAGFSDSTSDGKGLSGSNSSVNFVGATTISLFAEVKAWLHRRRLGHGQ